MGWSTVLLGTRWAATVKPAPGATESAVDVADGAKGPRPPHGPVMGGILRDSRAGARAGNGGGRRRVTWRQVIVAGDEADEAADDGLEWDHALRARLAARSKLVRLPILLYEEVLIPLRVAFPVATVESGALTVVDLLVDCLELLSIEMVVVRAQLPSILVATTSEPSELQADEGRGRYYRSKRAALDWAGAVLLHLARVVFLLGGGIELWLAAQVLRLTRVRQLYRYIEKLNNDLATSASLVGLFKFFVVLLSVPHWVGCFWWAVAKRGQEVVELPSWAAQISLVTRNERFAPESLSGTQSYLLSSYMGWAGMTALGYGNLVISARLEVWLAVLAALAQIVFYAFVFGTLLHFLIRVDQNVLHHKVVQQAAERYGKERRLPPALAARIVEYYAFQHRKQAAGTAKIFAKMPLSMRTDVATAQYARELAHSWLFRGCSAQLHSSLVLLLHERFVLPREVLFCRGDGSTELLWCAAGALDTFKGDKYVSTIRSDFGPGQLVGEVAFLLGVQQPHTVKASAGGDVTLIVLSKESYERVLASFPEEKATVLTTFLRKYGLDQEGNDVGALEGERAGTLDEDELKELQEQKAAIRRAILARHEQSLSEMSAAVAANDVEGMRLLLARGYAVDTRDFDARTALHLAAASGNNAVVAFLVEAGADVNCRDRWGSTPVQLAVGARHGAVAALLEASGAALEIGDGAARLHAATRGTDTALMGLLIQNGVDADARDHDGASALHIAATLGSSRVTEFLVTHGADVNAADRWGRTPLDEAIRHEHLLVAQLLVRYTATASDETLAEQLALSARSANLPKIKFIVSYGYDVDRADYDGRTALHAAVAARSLSAAHLLLASMADPSVRDKWGRTPVAYALEADAQLAALLLMYADAEGARAEAAQDETLSAALAVAQGLSSLTLMQTLNAAQKRAGAAAKQRLALEHEIDVSLQASAKTVRALARDGRELLATLGPRADGWVDLYGLEDEEEEEGEEEGGAGRGGSGARSDDGSSDSDEPQPGGSEAKDFVRVVLQLSRAEAGLCALRALYDRALRGARGLVEEGAALERMLVDALGLDGETARAVADELTERLSGAAGAAGTAVPPSLGGARRARRSRSRSRSSGVFRSSSSVRAGNLYMRSHGGPPPADELLGGGAAGGGRHSRAEPAPPLPLGGGGGGGGAVSRSADWACAADAQRFARAATHGGGGAGQPGRSASCVGSCDGALESTPLSHARGGAEGGRWKGLLGRQRHGRAGSAAFSSQGGGLMGSQGEVRRGRTHTAGSSAGVGGEADAPASLAASGFAVLFTSKPFVDAMRSAGKGGDGLDGALGTPTARRRLAGSGADGGAPPAGEPAAAGGRFSRPSRGRSNYLGGLLAAVRPSMRPSSPLDSEVDEASTRSAAEPVSAAGAPAGGDGGAHERTAAAQVALAVGVMLRLFRVFAAGQSTSVRLSKVRAVQRQVGEMGGADVKGLHRLLAQAAIVPTTTAQAKLEAAAAAAAALAGSAGSSGVRVAFGVAPGARDSSASRSRESSHGGGSPAFGALGGRLDAALVASLALDSGKEAEAEAAEEEAPAGEEEEQGGRAGAAGGAAGAGAAGTPAALADAPGSARAPADDATGALDSAPASAPRVQPLGLELGAPASVGAAQVSRGARLNARAVNVEQFLLGTAVWIMSGSIAEPDGAHADGAEVAAAAAAAAAAACATVAEPEPAASPPQGGAMALSLSALHEPGRAAGGGGGGAGCSGLADVTSTPPTAALLSAPPTGSAERPHGGDKPFAELSRALALPRTRAAIARAIQTRADTGRLRLGERAEAGTLHALVLRSVATHPDTSVADVRRWCAEQLRLDVAPRDGALPAEPRSAAGTARGGGGGGGEAEGDEAAAGEHEAEEVSWARLCAALHGETGAAARQLRGGGGGAPTPAAELGDGLRPAGAGGGASALDAGRPWFVISARGALARRLHAAFLTLTVLDIFLVPVQLAYAEHTLRMPHLRTLTLCIDALYWGRMGLRFVTSYVNESSVEVFELGAIREHYLHSAFSLDLLANFPFEAFIWALGAEPIAAFVLRLLRLVNARATLSAYLRWRHRLKDTAVAEGIGHYILVLVLALHLSACVWHVLGHNELISAEYGTSWSGVDALQREAVGASARLGASPLETLADAWVLDVFFVLSVMSTIGLSTVPTNALEIGFVISLMLLNMTVYAWTVGQISGLVMRQDDDIVAKRAQLELVQSFIKHARVPLSLKARMSKFFITRLQAESLSDVRDEEIYSGLPMALQIDIAAYTTRPILEASQLLSGCSHGFCSRLASMLSSRALDADSALFRAGEACTELLFVSHGAVEMYVEVDDGEHAVLDVRTRGEPLGELSFVFGTRHVCSARTLPAQETRVLVLTAEAYKELVETFPGQADVVMDNAMSASDADADGTLTARSARSVARRASLVGAGGAPADGAELDGRSDAGSVDVGAKDADGGGESDMLQAVVASARRKQANLQHMRLCLACAAGDVRKVQRLLHSAHADVDGADFLGRTALHLAACGGHATVIKVLLAHRAAVDAADASGSTPLLDALRAKHIGCAELLAGHGGTCGSGSLWQQLLFAMARDPAAGAELRAMGPCRVEINATDAAGRTALHIAAADGVSANIEVLLELGARVDATDVNGMTPLQDALLGGHEACFHRLLHANAPLGALDAARRLNHAAFAHDTAALGRLLQCRCEVNAADAFGRTPLHVAVSTGHEGCVYFLLTQPGINVNAEDAFGRTPLDDAHALGGGEPVLPALLGKYGGARGSGERRLHAPTARGRATQEEERLAADRAAVTQREAILAHAKELHVWARDMAAATAAFAARVGAAAAHERQHGPSLADAMPELWGELRAFADRLLAHRRATLLIVLPALERFAQQTAPYAASSAAALKAAFAQLMLVHERLSRPLLHLADTEFRASSGGDGGDGVSSSSSSSKPSISVRS